MYTQTTQVEKEGMEEVGIDTREIDIKEENAIEAFFQKGCACKGQHPCYLQFPKEHYRKMRNDFCALDQDPKCLDLLITGQIMANCNREMDSEEEKGSKNTRTGFYHLSKKVKQLQYYTYFYSDFIHLTDLQSNFPFPTRNRGNSVQESEGQLH